MNQVEITVNGKPLKEVLKEEYVSEATSDAFSRVVFPYRKPTKNFQIKGPKGRPPVKIYSKSEVKVVELERKRKEILSNCKTLKEIILAIVVYNNYYLSVKNIKRIMESEVGKETSTDVISQYINKFRKSLLGEYISIKRNKRVLSFKWVGEHMIDFEKAKKLAGLKKEKETKNYDHFHYHLKKILEHKIALKNLGYNIKVDIQF